MLMKRIIAVCMLMVLIVSQTACTFSRNNDRAVIPGSSITPAPGAAKEIKGDGENPTLTGVLTLRDADTGRMRFVDRREQNMKSLIQAVQIFRMLTER
jgi:hypothetical protein